MESYPCQHNVTITDANGNVTTKRMNGREIYILLTTNGFNRETHRDFDHFDQYAGFPMRTSN